MFLKTFRNILVFARRATIGPLIRGKISHGLFLFLPRKNGPNVATFCHGRATSQDTMLQPQCVLVLLGPWSALACLVAQANEKSGK